jgi:hypothetical protein
MPPTRLVPYNDVFTYNITMHTASSNEPSSISTAFEVLFTAYTMRGTIFCMRIFLLGEMHMGGA